MKNKGKKKGGETQDHFFKFWNRKGHSNHDIKPEATEKNFKHF